MIRALAIIVLSIIAAILIFGSVVWLFSKVFDR